MENLATNIWTPENHFERHDRERHAFNHLSDPEKARFQIRARAHYESNNWSFLRDCVYTLDQVDETKPIKPFPSDLEYLRFLTHLWNAEKLLGIPKSRRMTCSWLFISLYLHNTIFAPGRFNAFVSKKEDDAGELVARAEHIFRHIPDWRIPSALLPRIKNDKMSQQPPIINFEDINSKIQGFPQGADQLRQFTLSGILGDECAFWEHARRFYSASKPTLDGGGRMTLISSRSPGFFKLIVFDKLDATSLSFREVPPAPAKTRMEGVEVWRNPRNKFVVVDLHYTAHPAKRGKAWRESVRQSMPSREFEMEYEKSWQTFEGKPVYGDFSRKLHVTFEKLDPEPGIPLLLGWDFGLTPACVLTQLVGRQLRVLNEFIESDGGITTLAPKVWSHLKINFAPWVAAADDKIFSFIDPAGFQRSQVDEKTCAQALRLTGFKKIYPGPVDWEARKQAVESFLTGLVRGQPSLQISDEGAPILIEGFAGGYQYPPKAIDIEPTQIRPIKNKWSHPHDGFQYVCHGAIGKAKQHGIDLFPPQYGFQQR